jgi:hypothetical protein
MECLGMYERCVREGILKTEPETHDGGSGSEADGLDVEGLSDVATSDEGVALQQSLVLTFPPSSIPHLTV